MGDADAFAIVMDTFIKSGEDIPNFNTSIGAT